MRERTETMPSMPSGLLKRSISAKSWVAFTPTAAMQCKSWWQRMRGSWEVVSNIGAEIITNGVPYSNCSILGPNTLF